MMTTLLLVDHCLPLMKILPPAQLIHLPSTFLTGAKHLMIKTGGMETNSVTMAMAGTITHGGQMTGVKAVLPMEIGDIITLVHIPNHFFLQPATARSKNKNKD